MLLPSLLLPICLMLTTALYSGVRLLMTPGRECHGCLS